MQPEAIAALEQLNSRLRQHFSRFEGESSSVASLSSQQFAELFDDLLQVPASLRKIAADKAEDCATSAAIAEFRRHFATLQRLLPAIQTRLLAERIRLEGERQHLRAATAWVRASKDSLSSVGAGRGTQIQLQRR